MKIDKAIDPRRTLSGKVISVFLAVVMVVSMCPMPGFAKAVAADTDTGNVVLEATDLPGTDNSEGVEGSAPASGTRGIVFIGDDPGDSDGTPGQIGLFEGETTITYEDPNAPSGPGVVISPGSPATLDPDDPDLPGQLGPEDIDIPGLVGGPDLPGQLGPEDIDIPGLVGDPEDPQSTFEVTFTADGETVTTITVTAGEAIGSKLPAGPTKPGWNFVGWFDGETEITASTVPTGAITAQARYVEIEYWQVTFYNRDGQVLTTASVEKGTVIGSQLPPVIQREDYIAYWAEGTVDSHGTITITGDRIDASWVPQDDATIVPDYDKVTYTVTFYPSQEAVGTTEVVATRTVNADTSYCLNDIPAVPAQPGSHGKWVYTGGDFSNSVVVSGNMSVWADYEQTVFTVKFMVDGEAYETDTYYSGDSLALPADPVVEGKEFTGWFIGETQYYGGESVTTDLTLEAVFSDSYSVSFVILGDDGETVVERLQQFFRSTGEPIRTMPQDPFVAGKVFVKWVVKGTDNEVTADTIVEGNMIVAAVFRDVAVYSLTVEYYYLSTVTPGKEVIFNTDLMQLEASDLPYTLVAPSTTQTDPNEVTGGPIYYPETPSQELDADDFAADNTLTVRVKFVPYTAEYDFVYKVKNLDDEGYTEIERTHVFGVLNSYVTPTVKTYDYYTLEIAQGATITQASGQELEVLYVRKNFSLSYEPNGGSYVAGGTYPYKSSVSVSTETPTRDGYTFAGWYLDQELSQPAGTSVTIEGNTTLYAKWNAGTVNYTIVYMFEKYNDAGTASSYVYDNSRSASGTVGSTVQAADAPAITRQGWEADTDRNAASSAVVAADGSTVLYVYYKLTTYTFYFNLDGTYYAQNGYWGSWQTYNRFTASMTMNGTTYTQANSPMYSFTAKLGQDISSLWPSSATGTYREGNRTRNLNLFGWKKGETQITLSQDLHQNTLTVGLIPETGTTLTFYSAWTTGNTLYTVNIYLQNPDDDGYTLSDRYSQTFYGGQGVSWSHDPINGYIYNADESTPDGQNSWGTRTQWDAYYDLIQYTITYYYHSTDLGNGKSVKFGADITGATYNWTPTAAQCGVDSDYTFGGWYADADLTTPYTFDKMPASNVALYAKWTAPSYEVSFVDGDSPSTQLADTQTVEKYGRATRPETDPTKEGYVFDGWYAESGDLFDWTTQITADTVVYAQWARATLTYTVHYVDEDGDAVATDKVVTNPNLTVGQVVLEQAISVAGYRPTESSKELTLALTGNELTFVYTAKAESTSYTVRYIINPEEYSGDIPVAAEKVVDNVSGDTASVIEMAAAVDYDALYAAHPELEGVEFFPDAVEKTLVLTADASANVFTFVYSSYKSATVTVNYVDMDGTPIADPDVEILKVGKTFTLSRTPIAGWELFKAVEGISVSGTEAGSSYKITTETTEIGLTFTLFYQKKVTITAASASKQYDGTALVMPSALSDQVTVEGLLDGHELSNITLGFTNNDVTGGRKGVGIATVTPSAAVIVKANGDAVSSDYYKARYISGTLEVTPIYVTIRIEPDRWTGNNYNGEPYKTGFTNGSKPSPDQYILISHEGYAATYLDAIWEGVRTAPVTGSNLSNVTQDSSAAGLGYVAISYADAGDYTYQVQYTVADLPVDPNYQVSLFVRDGRLEIKPLPITIETGSATKPYDGTPLTSDEYTVTGILAGETYGFECTGSQTEIGIGQNTYTMTWAGEGNSYTAKQGNYVIQVEALGALEVTASGLTIVVNDKTLPYSGAVQTGYTISEVTGAKTGDELIVTTDDYTVSGLAVGDKLTVTYQAASGTDAGTYTNGAFETDGEAGTIRFTVENSEGEDVSSSYTVASATAGKLIITPVKITLTANSGGPFTYDGEEHEVTGFTCSLDGETLEGVTFPETVIAAGSGIDAGNYEVDFEGVTVGETTDTSGNYLVAEIVEGAFVIAPAKVTLQAVSEELPYSGTTQTISGFTVLIDGSEVSGITFSASVVASGSGEMPGEYPVKFEGVTVGETTDTTGNYLVAEIVDGALVILNTTLKATAPEDVVYDGEEHKLPPASVTDAVTGAILVEGTDYELSWPDDDYTNVGEKTIRVTGLGAYASRNIVTVTYKIVEAKIIVVIRGEYVNAEYDGTEHVAEGFVVEEIQSDIANIDELFDADNDIVYNGEAKVSRIYSGYTWMGLDIDLFENTNPNFTVVFQLAKNGDGFVNVLNAPLVLVGKDYTKDYDGEPLTPETGDDQPPYQQSSEYPDYWVASTDEIASVTTTGSQTLVGSSEYEIVGVVVINSATGDDVTSNYDLKFFPGTLTVTDQNVSPEMVITKTPGNTGEDPEEPTTLGGSLKVSKFITSTPANGSYYELGETIEYRLSVTNNGDVDVTNVVLTDNLTGQSWDIGALAPGASANKSCSYTVTEADIVAGKVENTATGTGTDTNGKTVTDEFTATTTLVATPHLTVVKTVAAKDPGVVIPGEVPGELPYQPEYPTEQRKAGRATADPTEHLYLVGETISYVITVTNDGNLTVSDILVTDELTADEWPVASLEPGKSVTFLCEHVVTADDAAAGYVTNTAVAEGTAANGAPTEGESSVTVPASEVQEGHLTIVKETTSKPSNGEFYQPGEIISYKITVTNDGDLDALDILVSDELTGDEWPVASIKPGDSVSFVCEYVVTEKDAEVGSVTNEATAAAVDPNGDPVPVVPGTDEEPTGFDAQLKVTKEIIKPKDAYHVGDEVYFLVTYENVGTVALTALSGRDDLTDETWKSTEGPLAPGEKREWETKAYIVTTADLEAGSFTNTASVSGKDPLGNVVTDEDSVTATVEAVPAHLTVVKTIDSVAHLAIPINPGEPGGEIIKAARDLDVTVLKLGDLVTYAIVVTNDSSETVTNITVTDPLTGDEWTIASLAPGESETLGTQDYEVTSLDLEAGSVTNVATATGKDPSGNDVVAEGSITTETEAALAGKLTVTKEIINPKDAYHVGDEVVFLITVENTGTVTISRLAVEDELTGDGWKDVYSLDSGQSTQYTSSTYIVTSADLAAGEFTNTATARGEDPDGNKITGKGSVTAKVEHADAELTVTKSIIEKGVRYAAGDTVIFDVTVTNTGIVTIDNIEILDKLVDGYWDDFEPLAPGESISLGHVTYTVTPEDVFYGDLFNVATAIGTDPDGNQVMAEGEVEVPLVDPPAASITITKEIVDPQDEYTAGDVVWFIIRVTNTGTETISNLDIADKMTGDRWTELKPIRSGEIIEFTTNSYTVTSDDLIAGELTNVATVTGTSSGGTAVSAQATVDIPLVEPHPALEAAKDRPQKDVHDIYHAGNTLTWWVYVTNTGNVTLTNIQVTDPLGKMADGTTDWAFTIDKLEPGEQMVWKYADGPRHTFTEEEEASGSFTNTVYAECTWNGQTITAQGSETIRLGYIAEIAVDGSYGKIPNGYFFVPGETIEYTMYTSNRGNLILQNVTSTESLQGNSATYAQITLYNSYSETYTYVCTESDAARGYVEVTFTATGTDQDGNPANCEPYVMRIPCGFQPSIDSVIRVTSTPANGTGYVLGETIAYTAYATNDGPATLTDVTMQVTGLDEPIQVGTLEPGQTYEYSATHVVTEFDFFSNKIWLWTGAGGNYIYGSGEDPQSYWVDDDDETQVPLSGPRYDVTYRVTSSPAHNGRYQQGEVITYTLTMTNSGDVDLTDAHVTAPLGGEYVVESLPVGESSTSGVFSYTVTAADCARGYVTMTANGYAFHGDQRVTPRMNVAQMIPCGRSGMEEQKKMEQRNVEKFLAQAAPQAEAVESAETVLPTRSAMSVADLARVAGTSASAAMKPGQAQVVRTSFVNDEGVTVYQLGDTVTWTIVIRNIYDETKDAIVTEELDGITMTCDDYTVTENADGTYTVAGIPAGETATLTVTYEVTVDDVVAGKITNKAKVQFVGEKEEWEVTSEVPTATIDLTITATDASKPYDGTPLTSSAYEITGGALVAGNSIDSVSFDGTQTEVGTSENMPSGAVILDAYGVDVSAAYKVTYVAGVLEVTPIPITVTITGATGAFDYDGSSHTVSGYSVSIPSGASFTEADIVFSGSSTVSRSAVGTSSMGLAPGQFSNTNGNYLVTFNVVDGWVRIRPVTEPGGDEPQPQPDPDGNATAYTVHYYLAGTTTPVAPDKYLDEQAIGASITETAIAVAGYNAQAPTSVTITLEEDQDANVITFYYTEVIPDNPTPGGPGTVIPDDPTPQGGGRAWSLADLLLSIGTTGLSAGMLAGALRRRKQDEDEEAAEGAAAAAAATAAAAAGEPGAEEEDDKAKLHRGLRVASLVPTVGTIVLFILTQDLTAPMTIFDNWTLAFAGITAVNGGLTFFSRKKDPKEEEAAGAAAAADVAAK